MADIKIKERNFSFSVEEAYKSLRTNLFFCGREKQVIAVTSCHPSEGKSTVSLCCEECGKRSGNFIFTGFKRCRTGIKLSGNNLASVL